jgi:hypothetical protein
MGYPHDIHRCFASFHGVPARFTIALNGPQSPIATMRAEGELPAQKKRKSGLIGTFAADFFNETSFFYEKKSAN